jgi:hypothetical protein
MIIYGYNPTIFYIRMHHLIRQIPDSGNQMVHSEMHPTRGGSRIPSATLGLASPANEFTGYTDFALPEGSLGKGRMRVFSSRAIQYRKAEKNLSPALP